MWMMCCRCVLARERASVCKRDQRASAGSILQVKCGILRADGWGGIEPFSCCSRARSHTFLPARTRSQLLRFIHPTHNKPMLATHAHTLTEQMGNDGRLHVSCIASHLPGILRPFACLLSISSRISGP